MISTVQDTHENMPLNSQFKIENLGGNWAVKNINYTHRGF
jgi:hypothetical protein